MKLTVAVTKVPQHLECTVDAMNIIQSSRYIMLKNLLSCLDFNLIIIIIIIFSSRKWK